MISAKDLQFLVTTDIRPPGVMPSVMSALSSESDSTALRAEYSLLISAFDFVSALRSVALAYLPGCQCQLRSAAAGGYDVIVRPSREAGAVFHAYVRFDEDKDVFEARRLHFGVHYWGDHDTVAAVAREMRDRFGQSRLATVEWWYQTRDGADYRNITMQPPPAVHDSFYPWLG